MARQWPLRGLTGAVLLALLAGSTGCTGGGGDGGEKAKPAVPEPLKQLWDTELDASSTGQIGWVTDHMVTFWSPEDGTALSAFDADSGKRRWQLALPRDATEVCQLSPEVNEQGVGGVVFAAGDGGACSLAAAVDSRTGKVLWTESLGKDRIDRDEESTVSVSEKALTVGVECGERRLRLKDGGPLPTLPPAAERGHGVCGYESARTAEHVAVRHEWEVGRSEDEDGGVPTVQIEGAFTLYDADTGKELWRRDADNLAELNGVLADDPLTLVTRENGQRYIRTFDGDGKPVRRLGKELHGGNVAQKTFVADGVLVTSFGQDPNLYAYDLRTGKELWRKALEARTAYAPSLLGISGGQLVAETSVIPKGESRLQPWLRGFDLRDGTQRTLGRLKQSAEDTMERSVLHKQRLYTVTEGKDLPNVSLASYAVPERGGSTVPHSPGGPGETPYPYEPLPEPDGWRKEDLRADEVATACEAVTAKTREKMMLRGDRPPPDDCVWEEWSESRFNRRELSVQVEAHRPGEEKAAYDRLSEDWKKPAPVSGLGDQAKAVVDDGSTDLLVRYRNVTIDVTAENERNIGASPTPKMLESAARAAAMDVLKALKAK